MAGLEQIGADVESALERVSVPAYVIDRHGVIRWINAAAERLVGDVRGKQMTSPLAPEERRRGMTCTSRAVYYSPMTAPRSWMSLTATLFLRGLVNPRLALDLSKAVWAFRRRNW